MAPNWDSWGKIRILGGIFDAELVSNGWGEDIKLPAGSQAPVPNMEDDGQDAESPQENGHATRGSSAIAQYEHWCRDPNDGGLAVVESAMGDGSAVGVESEDPQEFFERQLKILEAFRSKVPEKAVENSTSSGARRSDPADEKSVNDHIGPVQFNMSGIQVDADDMLQRLKVKAPTQLSPRDDCEYLRRKSAVADSIQDRNARVASSGPDELDEESPTGNMAKEYDTEQLQSFFSGLMNRTAGSTDGPRS